MGKNIEFFCVKCRQVIMTQDTIQGQVDVGAICDECTEKILKDNED